MPKPYRPRRNPNTLLVNLGAKKGGKPHIVKLNVRREARAEARRIIARIEEMIRSGRLKAELVNGEIVTGSLKHLSREEFALANKFYDLFREQGFREILVRVDRKDIQELTRIKKERNREIDGLIRGKKVLIDVSGGSTLRGYRFAITADGQLYYFIGGMREVSHVLCSRAAKAIRSKENIEKITVVRIGQRKIKRIKKLIVETKDEKKVQIDLVHPESSS